MKIFLASSSPRRQWLLREVGFEFDVVKPLCEEVERLGEKPKKMVARLSEEKAMDVHAQLLKRGERAGIVIAADTTVVDPLGARTLGKPQDVSEAKRTLRKLSGVTHTVLTGYTILKFSGDTPVQKWSRVVRTQVKMRKLSTRQIGDYVASGEPMDKAGAYGAQGIGMCLIESIRGSYTNVVGLPMAEITADLAEKFKTLPRWRKS